MKDGCRAVVFALLAVALDASGLRIRRWYSTDRE